MTKNADYLNNLRSIMKKRNDFDTIEEKMADLKSRVGFDLVKNINTEGEATVKEAGCGCGTCNTCGKKPSKRSTKRCLHLLLYEYGSLIAKRSENRKISNSSGNKT